MPNERTQQVDPERLARVEEKVGEVLRTLHGPPPIDDRWRSYADSRDEHKERNLQQLVINIREKLEHDANVIREDLQESTEKHDKRLDSSDARLRKVEQLAWAIIGILAFFQSIDKIPKFISVIGGH